ncbi:MAG: MiaB/RimO family radical SAM methylthiotransferase, partial [Phycisphaerales bacterium]|nr:MiaB/RimO family radical SAM methylthiotransferase [Phycisphaerales bacterium]
MKIYLETLGCQMNQLDSELLLGRFRARDWDIVDSAKDADAVLYNTCSVRDLAEQKVYSRLGRDSRRKLDRNAIGRVYVIAVFGCMAQRDPKELRRRCKGLDIICAPGQIEKLPELLEAAADAQLAAIQPLESDALAAPAPMPAIFTDPKRTEAPDTAAEARIDQLDLTRDPELRSSKSQAFVRVARGCNNFCSYCIVPYVRGPERSREPSHILDETRRLVGAGVSEVTLIGQTVNRYCHTAGDVTTSFAGLLETLHDLDGLRRLRFVTSHPSGFGRETLEAMRDLPKVCEYMHMPAQHGSDRLLAAMNRGYTRSDYDALVDLAREIVPGVTFASD